MDYMVDLESFHGPLDLLLYLIDQNQVDIYDIPVARLSDQFMEYLRRSGDYSLDVIGDFLVMASYLLHLKARLLLPVHGGEEEEPESDPREELVQRLEEYKKYKEAAERLWDRQCGQSQRVFFRYNKYSGTENEVLKADKRLLMRAYQLVLERINARALEFYIPQEDVNIQEKMGEILLLLEDRDGEISFLELFAGVRRKREMLGMFLALLELVRLQKVCAVQDDRFGDIRLGLRVGIEDVDEGRD